jgi:hypothetical protein
MNAMRYAFRIGFTLACLAVLSGGCPGPRIGRDEYVQAWVLADLRAREKGTEPREELAKLLRAKSIPGEAFDEAQVEWFGREVNEEILRTIRETLDTPGFPSRSEYVRARVLVYLRARTHGTSFAEELRVIGRAGNPDEAAFAAAERIWVGDRETDEEIDALHAAWETRNRIIGDPRWEADPAGEWLEEELRRRGISEADWAAAEAIQAALESQEVE